MTDSDEAHVINLVHILQSCGWEEFPEEQLTTYTLTMDDGGNILPLTESFTDNSAYYDFVYTDDYYTEEDMYALWDQLLEAAGFDAYGVKSFGDFTVYFTNWGRDPRK